MKMGRPRSTNLDLPPNVQRKGATYYYVVSDQGCRIWAPLGPDRDAAFARAAGYRAGNPIESRPPKRNLRQEVMMRDGYRCGYCGATSNLCIDHVVPISRGGATLIDNLVTACVSCNSKKKDKHPRRFVESLQNMATK